MLFGDIDWNQVLMQGLIGGIIGGVIGLGVFLVKKMNGGGKSGPGDQRPVDKGS
jgi:hypothetical protein